MAPVKETGNMLAKTLFRERASISKPLLGFGIEDGKVPSCLSRPATMPGTARSSKQLLLSLTSLDRSVSPPSQVKPCSRLPASAQFLEDINDGSNFPFPFS